MANKEKVFNEEEIIQLNGVLTHWYYEQDGYAKI